MDGATYLGEGMGPVMGDCGFGGRLRIADLGGLAILDFGFAVDGRFGAWMGRASTSGAPRERPAGPPERFESAFPRWDLVGIGAEIGDFELILAVSARRGGKRTKSERESTAGAPREHREGRMEKQKHEDRKRGGAGRGGGAGRRVKEEAEAPMVVPPA